MDWVNSRRTSLIFITYSFDASVTDKTNLEIVHYINFPTELQGGTEIQRNTQIVQVFIFKYFLTV